MKRNIPSRRVAVPPTPAPPLSGRPGFALGRRWGGAAIVIAILLVYARSLASPFLFDDAGAILHNESIRHLVSWRIFQPPLDGSTTTGRPLVNASFAVNYALGGVNPWGYHAINLLLHAGAALALYGLLRRVLAAAAGPNAHGGGPAVAFGATLLWAVHPLLSETVVCVAQRTELLVGLLYIATLYTFTRGESAPERGRRWWLASIGLCALGATAKEVMVTAPLLVLLLDRTFFAGSFRRAWQLRRGYYIGLAASWLVVAGLLVQTQGTRGASAGFDLGVTPWAYLLRQAGAIPLYIKLCFWPHPLVLDYGTQAGVWSTVTTANGLLVLGLIALTGWALVKHPRAGFLGAWFFVILAPSSSFIPLVGQTVAEHRMYLPAIAVITGVTAIFYRLLPRWSRAALVVAAFGLGTFTVARVREYRDPVTVWTDNVAAAPGNARGYTNLGAALLASGQRGAALDEFRQAVTIDPEYIVGHFNYGSALLEAGRPADAVVELTAVVARAPGHVDAQVDLGNALVQLGRVADAIPHYEAALAARPAGDIYYDLGFALAALGRAADAATQFRAAVQADPQNAAAHAQLGLLFAQAGELAPAESELRTAVRLRPEDAAAQANLGNVLLLAGRPADAVAQYEIVLRLHPDDARARENLETARAALPAH